MINELILKNSPNSWLRNGFKKQCFIILFAVLYTGSQTSFKGLFISLFSILKDSKFLQMSQIIRQLFLLKMVLGLSLAEVLFFPKVLVS